MSLEAIVLQEPDDKFVKLQRRLFNVCKKYLNFDAEGNATTWNWPEPGDKNFNALADIGRIKALWDLHAMVKAINEGK